MLPQGLEYVIKLNDQISAPLKQIRGEIDRIGNISKDAMGKIATGVAGIVGAGAALYQGLKPAIEMSNALSNLTATGMEADSLAKVEQFALDFSSAFGVSAVEVVNSANEINRAIDGLLDDEIIAFSRSANLLAKATGSNTEQMGSYLGTMYGIFQAHADKMGKSKWIEMMAGQATLTANMYKSSGESLSQAFTNLTATAESKGVALAEQFAVLGTLQAAMPNGIAGTKYAAFLKGVGKAHSKLGLSFLDAQNRMKPITEILTEIKKKYGETIDEIEGLNLSKAFGSDDAVAVINFLLPKVNKLTGDIAKIGDVSNLDEAARVAKIVTSVWDRTGNVFTNIRQAIASPVLEKITPFFDKLADMGQSFVQWLKTYNYIALALGYLAGGIIALTAVIPVVLFIVGLFKLWKVGLLAMKLPLIGLGGTAKGVFPSMIGWLIKLATLGSPVGLMFNGLIRLIFGLLSPFRSLWQVGKGTLLFFQSGLLSAIGGIKTFLFAFKLSPILAMKGVFGAFFSFVLKGIMLLFSPLTLWIGLFAGIAVFIYQFKAEIAAFFQGVIKGFTQWGISFEPIKAGFTRVWQAILGVVNIFGTLFNQTQAGEQHLASWASVGEAVGAGLAWIFQNVIDVVALIADEIAIIANVFGNVAQIIIETWQNVLNAWGNGDYKGIFLAIGSGIRSIFTSVLDGVKQMFFSFLNWLIDKINSIGSYVGLELPKIQLEVEQATLPTMPTITATAATGAANMALQMAQTASNIPQVERQSAQPIQASPILNREVKQVSNVANVPRIENVTKINTETAPKAIRLPAEQSLGGTYSTLKTPYTPNAQPLKPKADSEGKIFALGSPSTPKLTQSPQINKTITTSRAVDQSFNLNGDVNVYTNNAEEFTRQIQEKRMLGVS